MSEGKNNMSVAEAQEEVRTVFLNGAVGQLVSGVLWLVSAALGSWGTARLAVLALVFGGMAIYPVTQLCGGRSQHSSGLPGCCLRDGWG
jgi:hypothetical protein